MFALGFFAIALGLYLADSAIKGRGPIDTLQQIIRNPGDTRSILRDSQTAYISPETRKMIAGDTSGLGHVNDPLIQSIIATAAAQIGKPYRWGGKGPKAFDCSGLIWYAYNASGVPIPRTTYGMLASGTRVARKNLRPGDLVFPYPGHVFLYIGDGKTIEAPHTGELVQYGTVYKFWTARRYV